MTEQKRKLILIAGIPGSGKTTCGNFFAQHYGYVHYDLEDPLLFVRVYCDRSNLMKEILGNAGNVVVTWGFVPDKATTDIVKEFVDSGFKLIWFDGNREAAHKAYIDKAEYAFNQQVRRIGDSKFVDPLKPIRINPFGENGKFKLPEVILEDMEKG